MMCLDYRQARREKGCQILSRIIWEQKLKGKNQWNWGKAEMWRDIENLFSGQFTSPWLPQACRNLNCRMKKWYIAQIPWQYVENIPFTHLYYSVAWRGTFFHGNKFSFHTSIGAESAYIGWKFDSVFSSYSPACVSQFRKGIFKSHFVFKTQLLKNYVHNIGKQAQFLHLWCIWLH